MAKQIMDFAQLCEALGVDRPSEVTRVVLDIKSGHVPMLLIERMADTSKIVAALTGPGIELRREDPGARPRGAPTFHGNVSGANIAWGNGSVVQGG